MDEEKRDGGETEGQVERERWPHKEKLRDRDGKPEWQEMSN